MFFRSDLFTSFDDTVQFWATELFTINVISAPEKTVFRKS